MGLLYLYLIIQSVCFGSMYSFIKASKMHNIRQYFSMPDFKLPPRSG